MGKYRFYKWVVSVPAATKDTEKSRRDPKP